MHKEAMKYTICKDCRGHTNKLCLDLIVTAKSGKSTHDPFKKKVLGYKVTVYRERKLMRTSKILEIVLGAYLEH